MHSPSDTALQQLCERLQVDHDFFVQCLQESVVEIHETEGQLDLVNVTRPLY